MMNSSLPVTGLPLFNVTIDGSVVINNPINGRLLLCYDNSRAGYKGIWTGNNPLDFIATNFVMQLSIAAFLTGFLQFLLRPLHQTSFVPQLLAGLLIGPSCISRIDGFRQHLFTMKSVYPQETLGVFGCMMYLFIIGLKMDVGIMMKCGYKAWAIGLATFLFPLLLTVPLSFFLSKTFTLEPTLDGSLFFVAVLESSNSFHFIVCLLSDLKLLNSELGHLATSASMISGMLNMILLTIAFTVKQSLVSGTRALILNTTTGAVLVLVIIFVMRPIVLWMVRQSQEGRPVNDFYIASIIIMIMASAILSEVIGQHILFGPTILGLAIPDGPPLGAALTEKLDWFVSGLMLPLFYMILGGKINVLEIELKTFVMVQLITMAALFGKLAGSIFPALLFSMSFQDSFILALMLGSHGFLDIQLFSRAVQLRFINPQCFALMTITSMGVTAVISPMLSFLYRPSKRYLSYKKRTIQNSKRNTEFRVLICVYDQENVPTIINLLEASKPDETSPIAIYILHLIELIGRSSPIFIAHGSNRKPSGPSELIVNAFRNYKQQNEKFMTLQSFTSVSLFDTIHDDICTLALNRITSFIIIPFHIQWNVDGTIRLPNRRNVNINVIDKAPCSVGILVDRGNLYGSVLANSRSFYSVCMIFLGGGDDREALSYANRMSGNSKLSLTLIRILPSPGDVSDRYKLEKKIDDAFVDEFMSSHLGNDRIQYREVTVMDGVGTVRTIRALGDAFQLVLVGRRHDIDSPLLTGITEWNEYPELGFIGDMLATFEFSNPVSVLVIQQHICLSDSMPDSPRHKYRIVDSYAAGGIA